MTIPILIGCSKRYRAREMTKELLLISPVDTEMGGHTLA
jgi:hypothetical protein